MTVLERCGNVGYVLHDRDGKFCMAFDDVLVSEGVHALRLPPRRR